MTIPSNLKIALRVLGGALAGMVATGVAIMAITFAISSLASGYGPDVETPSTGWTLVNLAYSAAAAALGGWIAQRIGRTRLLIAPGIMVLFMIMSSVGMLLEADSSWPVWYRWSLVLLPVPSVALGGFLAHRGLREQDAGVSV